MLKTLIRSTTSDNRPWGYPGAQAGLVQENHQGQGENSNHPGGKERCPPEFQINIHKMQSLSIWYVLGFGAQYSFDLFFSPDVVTS